MPSTLLMAFSPSLVFFLDETCLVPPSTITGGLPSQRFWPVVKTKEPLPKVGGEHSMFNEREKRDRAYHALKLEAQCATVLPKSR